MRFYWLILMGCLLVAAPAQALPVTFRYTPEGTVGRVHLAGTFNGWNTGATPMAKGADGAWTVTLDLAPGPYQYKYVLDGDRWVTDPAAPTVPPDGNNVLWVVPEGQSAERKPGDGRVLGYAVSHTPDDVVRLNQNEAQVRLRTAANDVQRVDLQEFGSSTSATVLPMQRITSDAITDTWSVTVRGAGRLAYRFALYDGATGGPHGIYDAHGFEPYMGQSAVAPIIVDLSKIPVLETPDWARDTVWYQIFPERFWNGDRSNDPAPPKGVAEWTTPLSAVSGNPNDHWWGGDLQGIIEKLPYLKSLGVTGLYLNPIFMGPDTHFYATTDYMKVAPELGDEATLKRLVDAAHKNGMRVMLDGVFNHTSVYHPAFRDILKNQERSVYKDWYHIRRFPVLDPVTHYNGPEEGNIPYEGWWGIKWMPKLNTANPATERYLLDVATYWIEKTGIDGWRLDVANEVLHAFWVKFRKAVKAAKPDALIVGEIWDNATPWLRGDQFDSVMNYRFRGAALDFFARGTGDAARFAKDLETVRNDYPPQATAAMFNLLGSHDTARVLNEAGGNARRVALATLFQMTYPGSPSVYYGDEIGMAGANDPFNRAPMVWSKSGWNTALLTDIRRAIALRRAHPALRGLDVRTLYAPEGGKAVAFLRRGGGETAITAFNASDEAQTVTIPVTGIHASNQWVDAWRGGNVRVRQGKMVLTLPPLSGSVLFPKRAAPGK